MRRLSKSEIRRRLKTRPGDQSRLFHYTVVPYLPSIIRSGAIRLATELVPPGERPAVWCSYNPEWEETANKCTAYPGGRIVRETRRSTHTRYGLARIEVDPASCPFDWKVFVARSGVDLNVAESLYKTALKGGARPSEWRVSFKPITSDQWVAIEVYDGEDWTSFPNETWQKAPAMLCL